MGEPTISPQWTCGKLSYTGIHEPTYPTAVAPTGERAGPKPHPPTWIERTVSGIRLGTIGDIPFFVSPWFLLLAVYTGSGQGNWALTALWAVVLAISVVVHELGHASVARYFRLQPSIMLHGLGGLCAHAPAERDRDEFLIVIAGPMAGYALGVAAIIARTLLPDSLNESLVAVQALKWLIWINFVISTLNLLPIWPLDGGRLLRLLTLRVFQPIRAEKVTHVVGIVLALGGAALALALGFGRLGAFVAVLLAWSNFQVLRGQARSGPVRSRHKAARALLKQADAAFAAQDWAEAARICHQIRDTPKLPAAVLDRVWHVLGVSTARLDQPRDALSFLRRAKLTPETGEERLRALLTLGDTQQAEELVESAEWRAMGTAGDAIVRQYAT